MYRILITEKGYSSMVMNGTDLYELLPIEVQEFIDECEDEEVKQAFAHSHAVYIAAGKPVPVTDETVRAEIDKATARPS